MKPRKPTNPTQPTGMGRSNAGRKGRPGGYSPVYTPEQTRRYKSQALRYAKALELAAGGPDFVQFNGQILSSDDAANLREAGGKAFKLTDRVNFRYASARSGMDYWTVRYGGGGLEQVEMFADVITTTGTDACLIPVVTWSWENPQFSWAAAGIKKCEGDSQPAPGTLPASFPGSYNPVPPGETRFVTVRSTLNRTSDAFAEPPGGDGMPHHDVDPPYVTSFGLYLTAADSFTTVYESGSGTSGGSGGGVTTFTYGYARVYLNGNTINNFSITGFDTRTSDGSTDYLNRSYVTTVEITGDGPLLPPPLGEPPPFAVPPGVPNPFLSPVAPSKATAGGTFTSNTFTASSDAAVQSTLDYTTVAGIGDVSGAIAVRLYTAEGFLLDEYSETPTNGGVGTLEHTFSLVSGQSYYFTIIIPESCYCDKATVAIGGLGFTCDCPDYTKTQLYAFNSPYNSEQTPRDWSSSAAGCDTEGGCKHIIGTQLFLGLPYTVPSDYPL